MDAKYYEHGITEDDHVVVVCINSLERVKDRVWECILLDECDMVRTSLVGSHMSNRMYVVADVLSRMLKNASYVVLCQAEVSFDCVSFYAGLMGIDVLERTRLSALKITKPEAIHPIRYTTDKTYVMLQVLNMFVEGIAELKEGRQPHDDGYGKPYDESTIGSLDLLGIMRRIDPASRPPPDPQMTEEECVAFYDRGGLPFESVHQGPITTPRTTSDVPSEVNINDSQTINTSLTTIDQDHEEEQQPRNITRMLARPFIVYCSSKNDAHIITHILKMFAHDIGMRPEDIRIVCAETKGSTPWHERFESDANRYSKFAQVLVCTSVMDTGVSLTKDYVRFAAFLDPSILTFDQALQFIVRSR